MGMSLPFTLYTTISPICVSWPRFQRNSKSPRWKAGSMLPDRTTTMGEGESVTTERPFQSMNAVERTRAKLRTWARSCLGCIALRADSMVWRRNGRGGSTLPERRASDDVLRQGRAGQGQGRHQQTSVQRLPTNECWVNESPDVSDLAISRYLRMMLTAPVAPFPLLSTLPQSQPTTTTASQSHSRFSCVKSARTLSRLSSVDAFGTLDCGLEKGLSGFHGGLLYATCVRSVNLANSFRSLLASSVFEVCFLLLLLLLLHRSQTSYASRLRSTCSSGLSAPRIAQESRSGRARDRFAKIRS